MTDPVSDDARKTSIIQLYVDSGLDFNEEHSQKVTVNNNKKNEIVFDLSQYATLNKLRLDPCDESCIIEIESVSLIYDKNEIEITDKIFIASGYKYNNKYYFCHADPKIYFNHLCDCKLINIKSVHVKFNILKIDLDLIGDSILALIFGRGHENQLWSAFSYLLTRSIKKTVRKFVPESFWYFMHHVKNEDELLKKVRRAYITNGLPGIMDKFKVRQASAQSKNKPISTYSYILPSLSNKIRKELIGFDSKPLISIIMPVFNVEKRWLSLAINSVEEQWYDNWELCIADDNSTNLETLAYLKSIKNPRIKITYLDKNLNISGASNEALKLASGSYIALMDNDDVITPDALYEVVKIINHSDVDFIYTDEDSLTIDNRYVGPHFKPDYSPDLLLTHNYITHFSIIKKEIIDKVGFLRRQYDGAQDHDLFLRVVEVTSNITHISKILYHWRLIPSSTNSNPNAKPEAMENARKVIQDTLKRRRIDGNVEHIPDMPYCFYLKRKLIKTPLISIIIPFKDKSNLLKMCIESILNKSTYKNYEIIGISNNSVEKCTVKEMKRLKGLDKRVHFHEYNVTFNFSKINNYAVENFANGKHLILLNNDIEIISPSWIENMLEFSQRENTGVVGAKLYYPDDTIQHAGVIVGIGGVAGHAHKYFAKEHKGYFYRASVVQNVSAVTAACLMVKKSIYNEMDGLNEELSVAFNDVDFCLRVQEKKYYNVFTPFTEAYHHESISRGEEDTVEKIKRFNKETEYMKKRHSNILKKGDPFYNLNLTLTREDFSLK